MAVEKTIASTSLAEVIDRILDKGIVIDAWVRVHWSVSSSSRLRPCGRRGC